MSRTKILFACVLVLSALLIAYDGLVRFTRTTSAAAIFLPVLVIVGAWILVGGWIGWRIVQMLGERMGRLYWPKETVVPPPLYFLTESYERQGRNRDALHEYEKILRYHPQELQAHIKRLRCCAIMGMDPLGLWKIYGKSFKQLESDSEKQLLTQEYEKINPVPAKSPQA